MADYMKFMQECKARRQKRRRLYYSDDLEEEREEHFMKETDDDLLPNVGFRKNWIEDFIPTGFIVGWKPRAILDGGGLFPPFLFQGFELRP